MAPKPTKPSEPDEQEREIATTALRGLSQAVQSLTRCVEVTAETLFTTGQHGTDYNHDSADHLGSLSRHLSLIVDSSRKAEAERRKSAEAISDARLTEHFRRMTPERRAQWVANIQAMDRKRSVLQ